MMKNNKWKYIVSSLIILLPMVFGLIFWNDLPNHMTTHWGVDGTANGWMGKAGAVFILPLLMLVLQGFAIWWTIKDQSNRNQSRKVMDMIFWIIPIISLFANGVIYAASFGAESSLMAFVPLVLGLMFIFIGNYMPKCKQNWSIGIKIKWTLQNEENWNATHRFAGKVWFAGGLILMTVAFLPESALICVLLPVIFVIALCPMLYSYLYHRKQVKEGTAVIKPLTYGKSQKAAMRASAVIVLLILIFAAVLMFTGELNIVLGEESFTIKFTYWNDLTVAYEAIDSIEFREQDQPGLRTSGFSSAKLRAGAFLNEEFGRYTRYSYVGCDACIVLKADEKILVFNAADAQATKTLYETIQSHLQ